MRSRCAVSSAPRSRSPPGASADEIFPVTLPAKKGDSVVVSRDEHPRETTAESLAKLQGGRAPGWHGHRGQRVRRQRRRLRARARVRGAVGAHGLTPKARVVAAAAAGVAPRVMGFGPAPATRKRAREGRAHAGRHRRHRAERGLRGAGARRHARPRARRRRGERQSERRRDRARPSARRQRRAAGDDGALSIAPDAAAATRCARCASASARASP